MRRNIIIITLRSISTLEPYRQWYKDTNKALRRRDHELARCVIMTRAFLPLCRYCKVLRMCRDSNWLFLDVPEYYYKPSLSQYVGYH